MGTDPMALLSRMGQGTCPHGSPMQEFLTLGRIDIMNEPGTAWLHSLSLQLKNGGAKCLDRQGRRV
jgi:hypothetical protein